MEDRRDKILGANLSGLIPVGDCRDEDIIMDDLKKDYQQLRGFMQSFDSQFSSFQSEVRTTLHFIQDSVGEIKDGLKQTATKRELNGVVSSLRDDVEEAKQCASKAEDAARITEAANRKFVFAFMGSIVGLGGVFVAAIKLFM